MIASKKRLLGIVILLGMAASATAGPRGRPESRDGAWTHRQ
jgi:hypothetical protein